MNALILVLAVALTPSPSPEQLLIAGKTHDAKSQFNRLAYKERHATVAGKDRQSAFNAAVRSAERKKTKK